MKPANAPSYDLFKLVVTIVLLAILLLMLLRGCATNAVLSSSPVNIATPGSTEASALPPPTETLAASDSTSTLPPTPVASMTAANSSPTSISPTTTATVISATPTNVAATATDSAPVEPSATAVTTETPAASQGTDCNTSVPSRLTVGQAARAVQRLNMRNNPSIDAAILQTNSTGTQVEIIGGPVCTPVGERAYLWWQIRLATGAEGWSAEAPLNDSNYLLEPIP